jgi:hypothetical protein
MLNQRFLERRDGKRLLKSYEDFSYRGYSSKAKYIFYVFTALVTVVVAIVIFYASNISVDKSLTQSSQFKDVVFALLLAIVCAGTIAVLASYFLYKVTQGLILTEFQNFIYASSAKTGNFFFLIIAPDGDIFYHDENFFQNFNIQSKGNKEVLDDFLNNKLFDKEFSKHLTDAVKNKKHLSLQTSLKFKTADRKFLVSVDRVRNLGYFLVISAKELLNEKE